MPKFTSVEFMTADEKALVLRAWKAFVASGFTRSKFTKRLYNHLIQQCSFIAHFNIDGFYNQYFGPGRFAQTVSFIKQFTGGTSVEYGSDYWLTDCRYGDINQAMVEVMTEAAPSLLADLNSLRATALRDKIIMIQRELTALEAE